MIDIYYMVSALLLTSVFTYIQYRVFQKKKLGQFIRQEGPDLHQHKMGTPSAGGISILFAILIVVFLFRLFDRRILYLLLSMLLFSSIGLFDDFIKFLKNRSLGFKARYKLALQIIFSLCLVFLFKDLVLGDDTLIIPFSNERIHLGIWYIPFLLLFIVSTLNAFNITDGLDGLLSGLYLIGIIFFLVFGFLAKMDDVNSFLFISIGAVLGFLWYNFYPASIFLGDTGAFALGGITAAVSILYHLELYLIVVGVIFVIETLSVIIQVGFIKTFGKKPFLMSPIHHHFEMMGWKEPKIIIRFWVVGIIFLFLSLGGIL